MKALALIFSDEINLYLKSEFEAVGFDFEGKIKSLYEDNRYNSMVKIRSFDHEEDALKFYEDQIGRPWHFPYKRFYNIL